MIKYKYLRYMAATGWGAVAMVLVLCCLWTFTELPVQDVIFYMIIAYGAVVMAILLMTEKNVKKQQRKPAEFKIITLRKEDWK